MSDIRTVFTDNDGDGVYDDIEYVVLHDTPPVPTPPPIEHHKPRRKEKIGGLTSSMFSLKTLAKIFIWWFVINSALCVVGMAILFVIALLS